MDSILVLIVLAGCTTFQYYKGSIVRGIVTIMVALTASFFSFGYFESLGRLLGKQSEGLLSISQCLSFTFLFSSMLLKPYVALEPKERDFIAFVTIVNMIFNIYFLVEALKFEKVFRMEYKHIHKFGKRIGIVTLLYLPHVFIFSSLLFSDLHNLLVMIIWLSLVLEALLLGILFKEIYDLLFKKESERKFEIDQNRKIYLERK